ncbi:MAG: imidazole glycerol phosphate synthase subunit HisH [Anaerolineae bacterium]|nr:imidazole glycerol phosphate synthase subunit HisH [Anaerolineae bacterium]
MVRVAIISYGMGNLRSVYNALEGLGASPFIASHPEDLRAADKIILPGVGAFGDGIANLLNAGWVTALEEEVRDKGKHFAGLCLGMQLLADEGTEHGNHRGLGWITGTTVRLSDSSDPEVRIPHIGWNDVTITPGSAMYAGLDGKATFYFVHSYALAPTDPTIVNGVCGHGADFAASIECGNIWATQYHPEKSQKAGLKVLSNFLMAG